MVKIQKRHLTFDYYCVITVSAEQLYKMIKSGSELVPKCSLNTV